MSKWPYIVVKATSLNCFGVSCSQCKLTAQLTTFHPSFSTQKEWMINLQWLARSSDIISWYSLAYLHIRGESKAHCLRRGCVDILLCLGTLHQIRLIMGFLFWLYTGQILYSFIVIFGWHTNSKMANVQLTCMCLGLVINSSKPAVH